LNLETPAMADAEIDFHDAMREEAVTIREN
jgi:hypothetical protein